MLLLLLRTRRSRIGVDGDTVDSGTTLIILDVGTEVIMNFRAHVFAV